MCAVQVILARDTWLADNGLMWPSSAVLYLIPVTYACCSAAGLQVFGYAGDGRCLKGRLGVDSHCRMSPLVLSGIHVL